MSRISLAAIILLLVQTACRGDELHVAQRVLEPSDSITVAENDSLFIGRTVDLAVGPDGSFYISDGAQSRVTRVDRFGRMQPFGRKGKGPGEFVGPSWLSVSDSLVYVVDRGQQAVLAFDVADLRYSHSIPLPTGGSRIQQRDGDVFVAAFVPDSNVSLARVAPDGAVSLEGGQPPLARKHPMLVTPFGTQAFLVEDTKVYAINELSPDLHSWPRSTREISGVEIPRTSRRGISVADYETMIRDPANAAELAFRHSLPLMLARSASGYLVAAMYDVERAGEAFAGRIYITLIDQQKQRACTDALLPAPEDPPARIALRGDSIFSVEQDVHEGKSRTRIMKFVLQPSACTWEPLGPNHVSQ